MIRTHWSGLTRPVFACALGAVLVACNGGRDATSVAPVASRDGESPHPLLLSEARGGNLWANFCADQPDSATLPRDPRELIVPGVNAGKAVVFNAYWRGCDNGVERPTTCGEWREQIALGRFIGMGQGEIGTPVTFAGGQDQPQGLPAEAYNRLWEIWGLEARPDNFDELVAERHGTPMTPWRNPYPLPGEDPNATDGGSGQLPLGYTQIRSPDGRWTGEIGRKFCVFCHSGELGTPADGPGMGVQLGGAGSIGDFTVAASDFRRAQGLAGLATSDGAAGAINVSTNRGTGAIDFLQLFYIVFSGGDPNLLLNEKIVFSQAIGNIKSPPWWNLAYRPQKFHGAIFPTDAVRIDLAAYYDLQKGLTGGEEEVLEWIDAHAQPFHAWAESPPSPRYPLPIDDNLARQGAILFHAKDLWAENLNNPVPRPEGGNGSCASCHGVYSPHYAHNPDFLDTPELLGYAANAQPMSIIGTDPKYAEGWQDVRNPDGSLDSSLTGHALAYCGVGAAGETPDNTPIMLAPPLWGIWASAPYFHNGMVPNIWGVLDPDNERPTYWKRVSKPARPDQQGRVVMGFDTDLHRAYDQDKLGWKYEELECGDPGTQPLLNCNPVNPGESSTIQRLLSVLYDEVGLSWNVPRLDQLSMTNEDVENRKVYNTTLYSQGNQGHAFTSVLSDAERRALIEYLKTL
nr:hypothetical protein [Oceanococcus sp. HetDA_MAG_MS8]